MTKSKKILIVAAHPDDEILGCGGTVARLITAGYTAYTLILGEGITSRYNDQTSSPKEKKELLSLKNNIEKANKIIGIKDTFVFDFPDNSFDKVPLLEIVKVIEKIKNEIKPEIIFTHFKDDLNVDHKITYNAVITSTRPLPEETVKEIYSFEVLSSTEWNFPTTFSPDIFYDISETIDLKIKAMESYKSEIRKFPHPRSSKGIRLNAQCWGMKVGLNYAEAFKCVRKII